MAVIRIGNETFTDAETAKNKFMETFGHSENSTWAYMTIQVGFENGDTEDKFIADIEKAEETGKVSNAGYIERYLAHLEAVDIEFDPSRKLEPVEHICVLL